MRIFTVNCVPFGNFVHLLLWLVLVIPCLVYRFLRSAHLRPDSLAVNIRILDRLGYKEHIDESHLVRSNVGLFGKAYL